MIGDFIFLEELVSVISDVCEDVDMNIFLIWLFIECKWIRISFIILLFLFVLDEWVDERKIDFCCCYKIVMGEIYNEGKDLDLCFLFVI